MFSQTVLLALLLGVLPLVTATQDDMDLLGFAPPRGSPQSPPKSNSPESHPIIGDCTGVNGISPKCKSQESSYQRDFFYIGGGYVDSGIPGQQMWSNQLYARN
jgi:hypothetical protein